MPPVRGTGTPSTDLWGTMRDEFHQSLTDLVTDLADMCGRSAAMMYTASTALLDAELDSCDRVAFDLKRLSRLGNAVHDRAYALLALHAPVARDLRTVVSGLHIAADADRMGALAAHVARTARNRHPHHALPRDVRDLFCDMGSTAVELATDAQSAVATGDPQIARQVCTNDARMDALHRQLFTEVICPDWAHGPLVASDLVLLGRFHERFADHAVEIARRVYFQTTGAQLGAAERDLLVNQKPPEAPLRR